ncbi:type VII secretion target [Saccharopolyspora sp. NPDC002376]
MSQFAVKPAALRSHSDYLSELAGKISAAADKAGGVSFGVDSFGLVGQMFAIQARETSQQAAQQISTFSERTDLLGQNVNQCAADYEGDDQRNADSIGKIEV